MIIIIIIIIKDFHSYFKRAKVVGQNLNFDVNYVDGEVQLDGMQMCVNQVKSFTKSAQSRLFKEKLSGKPLHRVYVQCVEKNMGCLVG